MHTKIPADRHAQAFTHTLSHTHERIQTLTMSNDVILQTNFPNVPNRLHGAPRTIHVGQSVKTAISSSVLNLFWLSFYYFDTILLNICC